MVLALNYRTIATVISKHLLTVYDLKRGQGLYHESGPCERVISKTTGQSTLSTTFDAAPS